MMNIGNTAIGESIRKLREARGMTRSSLSEAVGISESHLKKIEAGVRQPGINTYQKIIEILGIDLVIKNDAKTIKGNCIERTQEILMNGTDGEAVFFTKLLEFIVENKDLLI